MGCVIPQDAQAEKGTRAWGARDRRTRTSSVPTMDERLLDLHISHVKPTQVCLGWVGWMDMGTQHVQQPGPQAALT